MSNERLEELLLNLEAARGGMNTGDIEAAVAAIEHYYTRKLIDGLRVVECLIDHTKGVDGLHRNGDFSPWETLRAGGRFEGWLVAFDDALEIANKIEVWLLKVTEHLMNTEPLVEGDKCPLPHCGGHMELLPVENCSCHIAPPCGQCMGNDPVCSECRYSPDEIEEIMRNVWSKQGVRIFSEDTESHDAPRREDCEYVANSYGTIKRHNDAFFHTIQALMLAGF